MMAQHAGDLTQRICNARFKRYYHRWSKTLGILLLVFGIAAILAIPILIGLIIDCIPLVLFGALFFIAFAGAIFKKGLEKTGQLDK